MPPDAYSRMSSLQEMESHCDEIEDQLDAIEEAATLLDQKVAELADQIAVWKRTAEYAVAMALVHGDLAAEWIRTGRLDLLPQQEIAGIIEQAHDLANEMGG